MLPTVDWPMLELWLQSWDRMPDIDQTKQYLPYQIIKLFWTHFLLNQPPKNKKNRLMSTPSDSHYQLSRLVISPVLGPCWQSQYLIGHFDYTSSDSRGDWYLHLEEDTSYRALPCLVRRRRSNAWLYELIRIFQSVCWHLPLANRSPSVEQRYNQLIYVERQNG